MVTEVVKNRPNYLDHGMSKSILASCWKLVNEKITVWRLCTLFVFVIWLKIEVATVTEIVKFRLKLPDSAK